MRTKTVLLAAALGVVGTLTAVCANVYSVNVVGYVNTAVCPGWNLIANPLDNQTGNGIANILAGVPSGTYVYVYRNGYVVNNYDIFGDGKWEDESMVLEPGEGFWLNWPSATAGTITFVGDVMQGTLTNPIPGGLSIRGSMVPQKGALQTVLQYPAEEEDTILTWVGACGAKGWSSYGYLGGAWDEEPIIDVGQGFWIIKKAAKDWVRTFNVE